MTRLSTLARPWLSFLLLAAGLLSAGCRPIPSLPFPSPNTAIPVAGDLPLVTPPRGTDGHFDPSDDKYTNPQSPLDLKAVDHQLDVSPYGLLNMTSNAFEWVDGNYLPYPGNKVNLPFGSVSQVKMIRGVDLGVGSAIVRMSMRADDPIVLVTSFRCVQGPAPVPLEKAVVDILTWPTPLPAATLDLSRAAYIPAGEFLMGSDECQVGCGPTQVFYLDAYSIDKYEVTVAEFVEFLNVLGGYRYACDDHPCTDQYQGHFEGLGQAGYSQNRFEVWPGQAAK